MASTGAEEYCTEKEAEQGDDTVQSGYEADVSEDESDGPERKEVFATDVQQDDLGGDHDEADPSDEDPNDEDQIAEASCSPEEAIKDDVEEGDFNDVEEHRRLLAERNSRLEEFAQRHPVFLPDQLDIQLQHVIDVLAKLPKDVKDDPARFREELVKRGVSEALINQQVDVMASYNAKGSTPAPIAESPMSPNAEPAWELTALNTPLPTRSTQSDQGQELQQPIDEIRSERQGPDQERIEHDDNGLFQGGEVPGSSPVRMVISALTVRYWDGPVVYSLDDGR